jgi:uncharacterized protein (DUF433 family)
MPTQCNEVITKTLDILGGTPVFRGTRVPFQALLDYLEGVLDECLPKNDQLGDSVNECRC